MKEWSLIGQNTKPNAIGGYENQSFLDCKDDAFSEVLETDMASSVILYNGQLKNPRTVKMLSIVISVLMLIFCILMAVYGVKLTKQFWHYTWVNIPKFKRGVTWICVPLAGITSTIYLLDSIAADLAFLKNFKEGEK